MNEIGGFFQLEKIKGNGPYYNGAAFDCARSSFVKCCQIKNIKNIYLPYFNCDVVEKRCKDIDLNIKYYHIDRDFFPILDKIKDEYIYIVNYYGVLSRKDIELLSKKYKGRIIVDNAQAFFEQPYENVASFNSCRKFFGVTDGSYLFMNESVIVTEPSLKVTDRASFLLGRAEYTASDFYLNFQQSEKRFIDDPNVYSMSHFSHQILSAIDYQAVINKRFENYNVLQRELGKYANIDIRCNSVPMVYPFVKTDSSFIRSKLIENKIYVPKYWDSHNSAMFNEFEKMLCNDVLPLPIDQRYGPTEMEFIVKIIKDYLNK